MYCLLSNVEIELAPRLHMDIMSNNYAFYMLLTEAKSGNEHTCWKLSGEARSMRSNEAAISLAGLAAVKPA